MDIIRNFIKVSGISGENELPGCVNGQIVQYSENNTIYIPKTKSEIHSLYHVIIEVDIKSYRKINNPFGTTIVLDGVKRLKITYCSNDKDRKANFLNLELPYNTFVELPENMVMSNFKTYIIDAYFSLLSKRSIYSHIVYMIYAGVDMKDTDMEKDLSRNMETGPEVLSMNKEKNYINQNFSMQDIIMDNKDNLEIKSGGTEHELLIDIDSEYF